jgi:hypothetical protein
MVGAGFWFWFLVSGFGSRLLVWVLDFSFSLAIPSSAKVYLLLFGVSELFIWTPEPEIRRVTL